MRKLVVLSFITLDGVMQAPGGPKKIPPEVSNMADGWPGTGMILGKVMFEQMSKPFDLLLGRKTYEIFAAHWPFVKNDEDPIAAGINKAKKYVASNTLTKLEWKNSEFIRGDIPKEVEKLKEQNGPEIQVHGSGNLIQTLLKNDLVDEFRLKTFPITLGLGKRLFAEGTIPVGLKLLESEISPRGVIIATYLRSGEVMTGSFALEIPTEAELARRKRIKEEN